MLATQAIIHTYKMKETHKLLPATSLFVIFINGKTLQVQHILAILWLNQSLSHISDTLAFAAHSQFERYS